MSYRVTRVEKGETTVSTYQEPDAARLLSRGLDMQHCRVALHRGGVVELVRGAVTLTIRPGNSVRLSELQASDLDYLSRHGGDLHTDIMGVTTVNCRGVRIPSAATARYFRRGLIAVPDQCEGAPVRLSLLGVVALALYQHRTSTASCSCGWSQPAEDRSDAAHRAALHRAETLNASAPLGKEL